MTIREIIQSELSRQNKSRYWLAEAARAAGIAAPSSVYGYLAGTKDIASDTASALAKLLGIKFSSTDYTDKHR